MALPHNSLLPGFTTNNKLSQLSKARIPSVVSCLADHRNQPTTSSWLTGLMLRELAR